MSRDYQTTAEWRLNLGKMFSIHHIFIQYMTGNTAWGAVFLICYACKNIIVTILCGGGGGGGEGGGRVLLHFNQDSR